MGWPGYPPVGPVQLGTDLVDTTVGLVPPRDHPGYNGNVIKNDIVTKEQTSEGQGQLGFDLATILVPAGLAAKAKDAQKVAEAAKIAEAARLRPLLTRLLT